MNPSPTPHGVGGLKSPDLPTTPTTYCPTPHGVGGLKFRCRCLRHGRMTSHPSRGGWIEILVCVVEGIHQQRPTPHGVGGLKCTIFGWRKPVAVVPPLTGWVD